MKTEIFKFILIIILGIPTALQSNGSLYLYCMSDNIIINSYYLTVWTRTKGYKYQDLYTPTKPWRNTRAKQSNQANPWVDEVKMYLSYQPFLITPISLNISGGSFKGTTIEYGTRINPDDMQGNTGGDFSQGVFGTGGHDAHHDLEVMVYDDKVTIQDRDHRGYKEIYNANGDKIGCENGTDENCS